VALVRPCFGCLWSHPLLSLALVMSVTVRNPLLGQPSNHTSVSPRPLELVTVRILVIISLTRGL
jgi:hypothetical protein